MLEELQPAKKLPVFSEIKSGIEELLLADNWDRYKIKSSPKKFNKRLTQLFTAKLGMLPMVLTFIDSDTFPFKFYRLRKLDKTLNRDLISEYSYPPNHIVKFTQRANIPYHPVFYCSDDPSTAIFETVRNEKEHDPNQYYYLSEWELKPNNKLRFSPFVFGNIDKSSPYKSWSDDSFMKLERLLKKHYPNDDHEGFIKIMELLSHLFIYEDTYTVSSFIAHQHLYANHNLRSDIFMYPSWQTDRKAVNFAIHPNAVTEKMQLKRVFKIKIDPVKEKSQSYSFNLDLIGRNQDSIIYWSQLNKANSDEVSELREVFHRNKVTNKL